MKYLIPVFILCVWIEDVFAQKPSLDTSALKNWPRIEQFDSKIGLLSEDGKYVAYKVKIGEASDLFVKSIEGNWMIKTSVIDGSNNIRFDNANHQIIYLTPEHRLHFQKLGTSEHRKIEDVKSFDIINASQNQFLVFQSFLVPGKLIVRQLSSGQERSYTGISRNHITKNGNIILSHNQENGQYVLSNLDLVKGAEREIWKGSDRIDEFLFSENERIIVFKSNNTYRYVDLLGSRVPEVINIPKTYGANMTLKGIKEISKLGSLLVLKYQKQGDYDSDFLKNGVKIFSYSDKIFEWEGNPSKILNCEGIYDIKRDSLVAVLMDGEKVHEISRNEYNILLYRFRGREYFWNNKQRDTAYILQKSVGAWKKKKINIPYYPRFSPNSKYVIGQFQPMGDVFSENLDNGSISNLTGGLPIPQYDNSSVQNAEHKYARELSVGVIASTWFNETDVMLTDHYDIWTIDVSGRKSPKCLTNGFGRKNKIIFRFLDHLSELLEPKIADFNSPIILSSFDENTKDEGFYQTNLSFSGNPKVLSSGSYVNVRDGYPRAQKAKNANVWLFLRGSATKSPNLFWTKDFVNFHSISSINPEQKFNWFSTELVNYKTKKGVNSQAILYIPDNLDRQTKHPVLFNFYELQSNTLNHFISPAYTDKYNFNFPMMLSQGYVICVPDIHFELGQPANSIIDCIEGAVDEIGKQRYIDTTRLGACGGSYGGYEVNLLAGLSNKFKALISISGISNLISGYGEIPGLGKPYSELSQPRMEVSLGTDPERYLWNSPIAYSKKVSTPLLIVNTLFDTNVNIQQGIDWFNSLSREKKPVWMLQYQERDHGIWDLDHQKDLYCKMNDFFGHYLKGEPVPNWMNKGMLK